MNQATSSARSSQQFLFSRSRHPTERNVHACQSANVDQRRGLEDPSSGCFATTIANLALSLSLALLVYFT
jgi:hypothetical protein